MTFDALTLEILWNRLISLVDEMAATLLRTSFSTVVGAANDFGCELLDANGRGLAHATRSMPVFNQILPQLTQRILLKYGDSGIRAGDIFITNDPWLCVGHYPDIAVILPFFRGGKRIGFAASIAHVTDIGGALDNNRVHEVYEEGLLIPLTRLYEQEIPVEVVYDFVRANVRVPEMVIGDIHAQVSCAQVGAQKTIALLDEYAMDNLEALASEIQRRSESAMRDAIRAVPDGIYRRRLLCDELDGAYPLCVAITVHGDELLVDFEGTAMQQPRGGVNCTFTYTQAHAAYALKCALLPDVPSNEGCYAPIRIVAPAGSVLNCTHPASVMNRTKTGWYIAPLIFGALASVIPGQVMASGGLMTAFNVYGIGADGQAFNSQLFNAGGLGAGARNDGSSTTVFPSSASNVPVELFEVAAPILVHEKEFMPDSAGAGARRGGFGQRVSCSRLPGYEGSVVLSVGIHRHVIPPEGLLGGEPGRPAHVHMDGRYLSRDEITANTGALRLTRPDQVVTIETAGGGGFGDSAERPAELIERDLRDGLFTAAQAKPPKSS